MSFFNKQTVDSIIADITHKIEALHSVAELHAIEEKAHRAVVAERAYLADVARAEFARAKALAEKFTALITP